MKSISAELSAIEGRLPPYPEPPDMTPLGDEIQVFVGRRSDQIERAIHPSTVFEMELDTEVQELSRQYAALQASVHQYLARHKTVATWRARLLYAVVGLTAALCGLVTWSARSNSSPAQSLQFDSASAPQTTASGIPPALGASAALAVEAPSTGASASSMTKVTSAAAHPISAASSIEIAPGTVLSKTGATVPLKPPASAGQQTASIESKESAKKTDPKEARIFALEDTQDKTGAAAPAATASLPTKAADVAPARKVVDPVSIKSQPVAKVVTKPPRTEDVADKPAKTSVEASKPAVDTKAKSPSAETANAGEVEAAPAPAEEAVKPVRKDHYGSSGVVTLMPSGVVVFDTKTKSQKLVSIGGKLPDGSVLKSVDAKASRIKTDKGEVEFD